MEQAYNQQVNESVPLEKSGMASYDEQMIFESIYELLPVEYQEQLAEDWQSKTSYRKVVLREGLGIIEDESYYGEEVYLVDLPTDCMWMPNNMLVFYDLSFSQLIGIGFVD